MIVSFSWKIVALRAKTESLKKTAAYKQGAIGKVDDL